MNTLPATVSSDSELSIQNNEEINNYVPAVKVGNSYTKSEKAAYKKEKADRRREKKYVQHGHQEQGKGQGPEKETINKENSISPPPQKDKRVELKESLQIIYNLSSLFGHFGCFLASICFSKILPLLVLIRK
jgi:hypothetical protein